MDLTKPSLSSKTTNVNNVGGNEGTTKDAAEQGRDGGMDGGEVDMIGDTAAAEPAINQQGAADKQRFNTVGYQRRTKQKVVTDYATVSKGVSASARPRAALIHVLFNQGVPDKSSIPEERGQLEVLKQALETFQVPVCLSWCWGEEGRGSTLENSWTEIVHSHSTMCKTQRHQQEALWEFVYTELTYINKLTIVTDLVMAALTNLHQNGFLLEVTHTLLFSNLPSILAAHRQFWQEVMYPMLQDVRRTGKPFDPMRLEAGCLQFCERFSSYLHYCWEEENTVEFTRKQLETNPHFNTYLTWVETHPQCERMRLGDMQAKPHQRVTKYPLLLKAVLKTTQDPHTQHTLQGMLASVNGFLDSINDYLRLKDEELALTLSAQRLDGYDVMEGMSMNEEIDKHVREFCRFDLMCPIRGVGPGVIRKLLLEETLKIRGRRDSKLEVVALLFSDVLLVTKVQKKTERLKVVRPPLALERTRCVGLKDGCSFLLVEVSDMGCAVNIYCLSASSSETCSTWLSTIHQAQETLKALRTSEKNRLLEANQRHTPLEITPPTERKMSNESTEKFLDQLEFVTSLEGEPVDEPVTIQSVNGTTSAMAEEAEPQTQATGSPGRQRKSSETLSQTQSACGDFAGWPVKNGQRVNAVDETVRPGARWDRGNSQQEEEYWSEAQGINERRATWNHDPEPRTSDPSDGFLSNRATAATVPKGTLFLLPGEYPEIDYPQSQSSENHPVGSGDQSVLQGAGSRSGSMRQDSVEEAALTESFRFSRKLKSPRLHRRRPVNGQQNVPHQVFMRGTESSNSDSDCSQRRLRGRSGSTGQSSDQPLVLKLGSLKMNRGVLWPGPGERHSPEPYTFSEPELPKEMPNQNTHKRSKVRKQRSVSNPDIIVPSVLLANWPSKSAVPHSPPAVLRPLLHCSPLEGLLERAKERTKDGGKREKKGKTLLHRTADPPHSPSSSTMPSRSHSEGDRETEWEDVVLARCRAPTVSQGWREVRVDEDEEANKNSPVFADGACVDWHGWCFDDDEVMDYLGPEDGDAGEEGLLEGIQRTLTLRDFQPIAEHEEGECSQV